MIRPVKIYTDHPENGGKLKRVIPIAELEVQFNKNYGRSKNFVGTNPKTKKRGPDYSGIKMEDRK